MNIHMSSGSHVFVIEFSFLFHSLSEALKDLSSIPILSDSAMPWLKDVVVVGQGGSFQVVSSAHAHVAGTCS